MLCIMAPAVLALAGCSGPIAPPAGGGGGGGGSWSAIEVAKTFDVDGDLRAVGVEAQSTPADAPATDRAQPLRLALLTDRNLDPIWPTDDSLVLDAALRPGGDGEVAYIPATGGALCMARRGEEASCVTVPVIPDGLDVAPDGRVAFVARTRFGTNVWTIDPRGTAGPRRITFGRGQHDRPLFDPEGNTVAYVAPSPGGLTSLFEVSAQGGEMRQLTNVGLVLQPISAGGSSIPDGYVPPPRDRASMRWDGTGLHYASESQGWGIDTATGEAREEDLEEVLR
jgi:hypothetical protein